MTDVQASIYDRKTTFYDVSVLCDLFSTPKCANFALASTNAYETVGNRPVKKLRVEKESQNGVRKG